MATDRGSTPAADGRAEHAAAQLETAMAEQARLGDAFAESVGTSFEQAAYARLRAASVRVSRCHRSAKPFSTGD